MKDGRTHNYASTQPIGADRTRLFRVCSHGARLVPSRLLLEPRDAPTPTTQAGTAPPARDRPGRAGRGRRPGPTHNLARTSPAGQRFTAFSVLNVDGPLRGSSASSREAYLEGALATIDRPLASTTSTPVRPGDLEQNRRTRRPAASSMPPSRWLSPSSAHVHLESPLIGELVQPASQGRRPRALIPTVVARADDRLRCSPRSPPPVQPDRQRLVRTQGMQSMRAVTSTRDAGDWSSPHCTMVTTGSSRSAAGDSGVAAGAGSGAGGVDVGASPAAAW